MVDSIISGLNLSREFLHIARLAKDATGEIADATLSTRTSGLWLVRNADGETICEVDARSGSVVRTDDHDAPPFALLDRIADMRRADISPVAIQAWLLGEPRKFDELAEARASFFAAVEYLRALRHVGHRRR
jgi:hypothetical protein